MDADAGRILAPQNGGNGKGTADSADCTDGGGGKLLTNRPPARAVSRPERRYLFEFPDVSVEEDEVGPARVAHVHVALVA